VSNETEKLLRALQALDAHDAKVVMSRGKLRRRRIKWALALVLMFGAFGFFVAGQLLPSSWGAVEVSPNFVNLIQLGMLAFAYFIPALNAWSRNHHNSGAILVLNLLLGWTVLGWVAALVWSATAVKQEIVK
jgi:Superinfection immunity protein